MMTRTGNFIGPHDAIKTDIMQAGMKATRSKKGDVIENMILLKKLAAEQKDTTNNFNDFKSKFIKISNQWQININENNVFLSRSLKDDSKLGFFYQCATISPSSDEKCVSIFVSTPTTIVTEETHDTLTSIPSIDNVKYKKVECDNAKNPRCLDVHVASKNTQDVEA